MIPCNEEPRKRGIVKRAGRSSVAVILDGEAHATNYVRRWCRFFRKPNSLPGNNLPHKGERVVVFDLDQEDKKFMILVLRSHIILKIGS